MYGNRAVQAPTIGIWAVGVGGDIATLHVVVVNAVSGRGGEGQGGNQSQGNGVTLHEVDLHVVVSAPPAVGAGVISAIASQHWLNTKLNGSIIVWCQFMKGVVAGDWYPPMS